MAATTTETENATTTVQDTSAKAVLFDIDLPGLATAFGQRLHEADMPVSPAQSEQYARSLMLTKPSSRERLYHTTRAIFVTDVNDLATFDRVFAAVFGAHDQTSTDDVVAEVKPPVSLPVGA